MEEAWGRLREERWGGPDPHDVAARGSVWRSEFAIRVLGSLSQVGSPDCFPCVTRSRGAGGSAPHLSIHSFLVCCEPGAAVGNNAE